jgi:hypothetical protein
MDNRLPLRARWLRLRDTVFRTLLHGAGGWFPDENLRAELTAVENHMLRLTLHKSRREDDTPQDFMVRLNRRVAWFKESFGWVSLYMLAVNLHLSWWGHASRHCHDLALGVVMRWRDAAWRARNRNQPARHIVRLSRPGRHVHFDAHLSELSGRWMELAENREEWRIVSKAFRHKFASHNTFCGRLGPLQMCANRFADWSRGFKAKFPGTLRLLIQSDSEVVVGLAQGRSTPSHEYLPYAEFLRWSAHALSEWGFIAVEPGFFVHRRREENQIADWFANCAVERGWLHTVPPVPGLRAPPLIVLVSDGACKNNPGPAGAGCAIMGLEHGSWSLLGSSGYSLGESTSVIAELEAACMCVHVLLLWCVQSRLASPIREVSSSIVRVSSSELDADASCGIHLQSRERPRERKKYVFFSKLPQVSFYSEIDTLPSGFA